MDLLYHASPVPGIQVLEPHVSKHGTPRVYFSSKRENVLVYLSNAVEKFCRETDFPWVGPWEKWGPYGFAADGLQRLEEYYPNALKDTYAGVQGYVYQVKQRDGMVSLEEIQDAFYAEIPIPVEKVEYIPDAYQAILSAQQAGLLHIQRYEETSERFLQWIKQTVLQDYDAATGHPEYRHFLREKFSHFWGNRES